MHPDARLAIHGGPPAVSVPYDERWRSVHASDVDVIAGHAMCNVATLSKGDGAIADFERRFAQVTGTRHALAMNSGTAALHSAYFAVGVSPGSEVIVPSYTFFASAAPILQCGATAVFCDVDWRTLTADAADVERRITPRTRAICVVHMWGNPASLDRFTQLARRHGVALIEDCSHAHGASYLGRPVGSWGDIGCFSLQGAKAVSGGEAGIAVTDDPELFDRMLLLGHYGRLKKGQAKDTFDTDHLSLGLKYRPHLYAVLLAQGSLSRLDELNRRRRHNYAILTEELDGCRAVQPIPTTPGAVRGGFLEYILRYDPEHVGGLRRDEFIAAAKAEGVPIAPERYSAVGRRARLLHESPVFASQDPYALRDGTPPIAGPRAQGPLPVTEALRGRLMTLPPFTKVPEHFVRQCARALRKVAEAAGRRRDPSGSARRFARDVRPVALSQRSASMTVCLKPVRDALDNARAPVPVFIRDDDAGWDDERLIGLLDLLAGLGLPVDLAAIPTEVGSALARELCERIDAPGPPVGVHQHGLAHVDHEREGRKAEFGSSRSAGDQRRDILEGRGRLGALLGGRAAPIFTPPWNRCSAVTATCLGELGFRVLSRDAAAPAANVAGLTEVPIRVDWFARRKGERLSRAAVVQRMAADITRGAAPLGVMLHHAVMNERERASAGELLGLLADHPMVRPSPILALAEPLTGARGRDLAGAAR